MDDPGDSQENDPDAMQRVTQGDLVHGIDFEEDEDDRSGGLRRDGQDNAGEEFVRRSEAEDGDSGDIKQGRVV